MMTVRAVEKGTGRVRTGRIGAGTGSSSPALSAQTIQFFDRLTVMPSTSRQTAYATLIDALVTAGVWTKLDALYLYAAADSATSLTNLVQEPYRGSLIITSGVPVFTVDIGWSNCGGTRFASSNFNPSTASGNYAQNNAMFCAWQVGTTQENAAIINDFNGVGQDQKIEIFPRWSDGNTYWAINGNGTELGSAAPANGQGFWLAQRTGASACEIHFNDTSIGTSSAASAALTNSIIVGGSVANSAGCMGFGSSLNSTQQTAFYNAMRTYMTAVGVP